MPFGASLSAELLHRPLPPVSFSPPLFPFLPLPLPSSPCHSVFPPIVLRLAQLPLYCPPFPTDSLHWGLFIPIYRLLWLGGRCFLGTLIPRSPSPSSSSENGVPSSLVLISGFLPANSNLVTLAVPGVYPLILPLSCSVPL